MAFQDSTISKFARDKLADATLGVITAAVAIVIGLWSQSSAAALSGAIGVWLAILLVGHPDAAKRAVRILHEWDTHDRATFNLMFYRTILFTIATVVAIEALDEYLVRREWTFNAHALASYATDKRTEQEMGRIEPQVAVASLDDLRLRFGPQIRADCDELKRYGLASLAPGDYSLELCGIPSFAGNEIEDYADFLGAQARHLPNFAPLKEVWLWVKIVGIASVLFVIMWFVRHNIALDG